MNEKRNEQATDTQPGPTPVAGAPVTPAAAGQTPPATPAPPPYATAGEAFTNWFNERVRLLPNPTLMLGTKRARVVGLHADGRLQVEVDTEALEPERQYVAFEASYLDQLVRKIAAQGV